MASLKNVRMKIAGVKKTKQITKAMNMVSSAKLRGAQARIEKFRPYADKFYNMLSEFSDQLGGINHPLLVKREELKNAGILLVTSDRGLAGAFNANLISAAFKLAQEKESAGIKPVFYCVGRKGVDSIRKAGRQQELALTDQMGSLNWSVASDIGNQVIAAYTDGSIDELNIIYGQFISIAKQGVGSLTILPVSHSSDKTANVKSAEGSKTEAPAGDIIYEPEEDVLLAELLPRFVKVQIHRALLDTSASEHAARMNAMDNATRNCDDITASLTLLYNKTRQAVITTELIDIVGGVEALNG
ncbi:MAG: ATP synthase F1 subunit gamma [Desulfovibrionaceae bacterium]|nr:ATP synthase F1 subunit gamma [Desulfovibrionaceae bacterium]